MNRIYLISGACGCGKSTFADAYAKHLVQRECRTVYMIHGDDFHRGFVEPEVFLTEDGQASDPVLWGDILRFNWDCIIFTASRAIREGLDVVIDYVVEDELPRVRELAANQAELVYIVLTADADEIERRIRNRGDSCLIERALFLKRKLESLPENRGHIYNNTGKTTDEMIREIVPERYLVERSAPVIRTSHGEL